ncbi:helix-turn-helix domain-containing protein [Pararhodospirillum oryzae]|uniref:Transcriptional regulator n=1 Tax=Pararhodospirillum oryzae TaxID=478448 RepID=A0A512H5K0_9PROT|nr:helix-turn-helix transcriptional regulator [Pararhodospirillum oryzae]GEO80717.1 transcriptional regulator [Pararhodospirillum oryzae]
MRKGKQAEVRPYTSDNPDPLDKEVGRRLRLRRKLLGMSQQQLADAVGITFQQVQKYERGVNRLSASRLWDFASILGVPVSFFFEDLDSADVDRTIPRARKDALEAGDDLPAAQDPLVRTETLELCYSFWAASPRVRKNFLEFLKTCATLEAPGTAAARAAAQEETTPVALGDADAESIYPTSH